MTTTRRPLTAPSRKARAFSAGYSGFVKITKLILPLAALVIIGIVVARLTKAPQQQIADLPRAEQTTPGQVDLIGGKYEGVDAKGRAYAVSAEKVSRNMSAPDTALLTRPAAEIILEDKTRLAVSAVAGEYDHEKSFLRLTGNVTIVHDAGNEMLLQDIAIDLKTRHAVSKGKIRAQGPLGTLEAEGVEVSDEGDLVIFTGPAKITLNKLGAKASRG